MHWLQRIFSAFVFSFVLFGCTVPTTIDIQYPASRSEQIRGVQTYLSKAGYNPGPTDGVMGTRTRAAIKKYQADKALEVTGRVTETLYRRLAADVGADRGTRTIRPVIGSGDSARGIDDPNYRRSISKNDSRVTIASSCKGLFIPKIKKELFRSAVPVWNVYFLNNSNNRYRVTYDVSYRKAGRTYFGGYNELLTDERSVTVRPGKLIQLPVLTGVGDIKEITRLDVFRCSIG